MKSLIVVILIFKAGFDELLEHFHLLLADTALEVEFAFDLLGCGHGAAVVCTENCGDVTIGFVLDLDLVL
jgi:hypothetical protein